MGLSMQGKENYGTCWFMIYLFGTETLHKIANEFGILVAFMVGCCLKCGFKKIDFKKFVWLKSS